MFKKNFRAFSAGFTMIELLVVTTIIIVLTTIGLVSYRAAGQQARNGKRKSDLQSIRQALVLYKTDSTDGLYPTSSNYDAMLGVLDDYLGSPAETFQDPKDDGTYSYTYTPEGGGSGFTLEAKLEPDGEAYQVTNP